jgi:hypothetical protein
MKEAAGFLGQLISLKEKRYKLWGKNIKKILVPSDSW